VFSGLNAIWIELFHDVIIARDGRAVFVARLDPDRVKERQLDDAIFREERRPFRRLGLLRRPPARVKLFYPVLTPSQWPKSHMSGLFSIDTRSELSTDDIICIEAPSRPRGVCVATTKIGVVGGDP
jgi:hypothetical protein